MIALLTSCENKLPAYEGESGIYFSMPSGRMLYTFYSTTQDYIDAQVKVQTLGVPANQDRRFHLIVVDEVSTAQNGKDYILQPDSYIMPAGKTEATVTVRLLYRPELDNGQKQLCLNIAPNEDFSATLPARQGLLLTWTNQLTKPSGWDTTYAYYFGAYSRVKHRYILAVLAWDDLPDFYDDTERVTFGGILMNNYFGANEVYDENNNLIKPWM